MLEDKTAYLITETNAMTLANITGIQMRVLLANLGWCMVYREETYPRWEMVPRSVVIRSEDLKLDVDTYA